MFENLLSFTEASLVLEGEIMSGMEGEFFGGNIDEFIVVTVVDNPLMPIRDKSDYVKSYHKVSRYKHPATKESIKYISTVLFFDREDIEELSKKSMCAVLAKALILHLKSINLKMPKQFDYEKFSQHLSGVLKSFVS